MNRYPVPRLSSSLILIKSNLQLLFMQRPSQGSFANVQAFPGGIVEDEDYQTPDVFKHTAIRETHEEVGISVGSQSGQKINYDLLHPLLRLITIPQLPKRYDTRYYVCFEFGNGKGEFTDLQNLNVSKEECAAYSWMTASEALIKYFEGKIQLAPPQFIILNLLSSFQTSQEIEFYLQTLEHQFAPYLIMLRRNQKQKSKYPFVAYNVFDEDYPVQDLLDHESSKGLLDELKKLRTEKGWKNRFYFSEQRDFFSKDFEVEVQLPFESPFNRISNYTKLKKSIENMSIL